MNTLSIAVAGSTQHTVTCATALLKLERFVIRWVLTPQPKPLGRKHILTKNPLQEFAEQKHIPLILLEEGIDDSTQTEIEAENTLQPIDFLLVVDFGYLIPTWLLQLPKLAALNIHPSALPKWRGSSPGQFSLLYGDQDSAVTLIVMDEDIDTGPIVLQLPFQVQPNWTQREYYAHSFALMDQHLTQAMSDFATEDIAAHPQPIDSPTPMARRLSREDSFVDWPLLKRLLSGQKEDQLGQTSALLVEVNESQKNWPQTVEHAVRAFTPWPLIWTMIPTAKGKKRMQILTSKVVDHRLALEKVKIEGQESTDWDQVKNGVLE